MHICVLIWSLKITSDMSRNKMKFSLIVSDICLLISKLLTHIKAHDDSQKS